MQHLERVELLAPFLREPMLWLIAQTQARHHLNMCVVFTWRSVQEQALIYQKGRELDRTEGIWKVTDRRLVVTNAEPGRSPHNVVTADGKPASVAADLAPITASGEIWYPETEAWWQPIYQLAWKAGLDPLGDTIGAYLPGDWGHFEEPGWKMKLGALGLVRPVSPLTV